MILYLLLLVIQLTHSAKHHIVHLFEWTWDNIALECKYLHTNNPTITGIQLSPATEDIVTSTSWWTRYQPVSYEIISRSGNYEQFVKMIDICNSYNIDLYLDVVINHMAADNGLGRAGNSYGNRTYVNYPNNSIHFHHDLFNNLTNCGVNNFDNETNVQECDLLGLPDLHTQHPYVQAEISTFLSNMLSLGIKGFRIDAAKHIHIDDLTMIINNISNKHLLKDFYMEISLGGIIQPETYQHIDQNGLGKTTNFQFAVNCLTNFKQKYFDQNFINNCIQLDINHTIIFTDNHDTQRDGDAILTYKDNELYILANVFMLTAFPNAEYKLLSGYIFNDKDQGPPVNSQICDQSWYCIHRFPMIQLTQQFIKDKTMIHDIYVNNDENVAYGIDHNSYVFFHLNTNSNSKETIPIQTGLMSGTYINIFNNAQLIYIDDNGYTNDIWQFIEPSLSSVMIFVSQTSTY